MFSFETAPDDQPQRKPDAILFPTGWTPQDGSPFPGISRTDKLCGYFERVLGGSTPNRPAYIKQMAGGPRHFVSLDSTDSLYHPTGHPLEKLPRYWHFPQPNGLEYLYFKETSPESPQVTAAAMAARNAAATENMLAMKASAKAADDKTKRFLELKALGDGLSDELRAERHKLFEELKATSEIFAMLHEGQSY